MSVDRKHITFHFVLDQVNTDQMRMIFVHKMESKNITNECMMNMNIYAIN